MNVEKTTMASAYVCMYTGEMRLSILIASRRFPGGSRGAEVGRLARVRRQHRQHALLDARPDHAARTSSQLQVAWTYETHDEFKGSEMQANPIVVDGVLYATTPKLRVFALDAATGQRAVELRSERRTVRRRARFRHRGVVVTGDRVLFTYRNKLCALDKKTGKPIPSFGDRRRRRSARRPRPSGERRCR